MSNEEQRKRMLATIRGFIEWEYLPVTSSAVPKMEGIHVDEAEDIPAFLDALAEAAQPTQPPHCVCGADPGDPGCAAHGGYQEATSTTQPPQPLDRERLAMALLDHQSGEHREPLPRRHPAIPEGEGMTTKSRCDRCRQPLYGLVPCPACRELMIAKAVAEAHPSPPAAPDVERMTEAVYITDPSIPDPRRFADDLVAAYAATDWHRREEEKHG